MAARWVVGVRFSVDLFLLGIYIKFKVSFASQLPFRNVPYVSVIQTVKAVCVALLREQTCL